VRQQPEYEEKKYEETSLKIDEPVQSSRSISEPRQRRERERERERERGMTSKRGGGGRLTMKDTCISDNADGLLVCSFG